MPGRVSEIRRLKQLEEENGKLKRLRGGIVARAYRPKGKHVDLD
jgi:hypothetical protein